MISVFTPFHAGHNQYILTTYRSLVRQTHTDWEWVLLQQDGAEVPASIAADDRVTVIRHTGDVTIDGDLPRIGMLKRKCCEQCSGDIYAELDSDDILMDTCLEEVHAAMGDGAQFVYSNSAQFTDGTWEPKFYSDQYGWRHRPFNYEGHELQENIGWDPCPQAMRRIEWSPNHIRAWTRECYWKAGGHDPEVAVGDDHDLVQRTYMTVGSDVMRHINKCLYLYRDRPDKNTCKVFVDAVQEQSWTNYHRRFFDMMVMWARKNNLAAIDLGGGIIGPNDMTTVDKSGSPDVKADLMEKWPFEDGSVGVVRASQVLEHLPNSIFTMNEMYRILAPGGLAVIEVPSTDGRGAFQDPTHCSFWNLNSFAYYTDRNVSKWIPSSKGRFHVAWLNDSAVSWAPSVIVTKAHLLCLKPPYDERPPGGALI